jgi:hypothetical protein
MMEYDVTSGMRRHRGGENTFASTKKEYNHEVSGITFAASSTKIHRFTSRMSVEVRRRGFKLALPHIDASLFRGQLFISVHFYHALVH